MLSPSFTRVRLLLLLLALWFAAAPLPAAYAQFFDFNTGGADDQEESSAPQKRVSRREEPAEDEEEAQPQRRARAEADEEDERDAPTKPTSGPLAKARTTPHFYQSDADGELPGGGKQYCGPVSLATAFVGLARSGCTGLADASGDFDSLTELISTLGSEDYCHTNPKTGTIPEGFHRAIRTYLQQQEFSIRRLEFMGWRDLGAERGLVEGKLVDLDWLRTAVRQGRTAVWLNVGWYKEGKKEGEWIRTGGHWMSIQAEVQDGDDDEWPTFICRNSLLRKRTAAADGAENPGHAWGADRVEITLLEDGYTGVWEKKRRSLDGMYQVHGNGLPTNPGYIALLDGATVLTVGGKE